MVVQANVTVKAAAVAALVTLTFAVAGLMAVTLLSESSVAAQNEAGSNQTEGNRTGTTNDTAIFSPTGEAPENKR